MLIEPSSKLVTLQPRVQELWNDAKVFPLSLGCGNCFDRDICGGLSNRGHMFNCLSLCCDHPENCDAVCRNKAEEFAQRVREVEGFEFGNVPRTMAPVAPSLPLVVPVIFHGNKRELRFAASGVICLPLFSVIDFGSAAVKFDSVDELFEQFKIHSDAKVMLTGTSTDPALEKWWSLGRRRLHVIQALKKLNINLVTAPNYSLFSDQPRWDDLHSMKRIAVIQEEFQSEGVACALHLNGRTERDWERWAEFISTRDEITHVSLEFATGAGWPGRIGWYLDRLKALRADIRRPIHLLVRGGTPILNQLSDFFNEITFVDTSVFQRATRRKAAMIKQNGKLGWRHSPTPYGHPFDLLLEHNWAVASKSYEEMLRGTPSRRVA